MGGAAMETTYITFRSTSDDPVLVRADDPANVSLSEAGDLFSKSKQSRFYRLKGPCEELASQHHDEISYAK